MDRESRRGRVATGGWQLAQVTHGSVRGFMPALTSFVGRARDVDRVAGLVGDNRWVTVTGPGGVGKTRLAAEVGRQVAGQFADGVQLVELTAVADPAHVPAAVAAVLRVQQAPGLSVLESLAGALARQQLLLVLDNCEHLLAGVAELWAGLVPFADDLRVLATSREPVGVAGETRYRLRPLAVPTAGSGGGTGEFAAMTLFTDRARQADPDFSASDEDSAVVGQIVARLDGMPLAIELAAARVEALGLGQLLERLDHGFALLASGDRLAAPRQRSLAATVEWSYQLLGQDEQRVFRRSRLSCAVHAGGRRDGAGAAAGPAVLHLVDCSLLTPPGTGPGWPRPVPDAGDPARLRAGPAGRCRENIRGRCRAGPARAAGGRAGRGRTADEYSGEGGRPVAGRRRPDHPAGPGMGPGARPWAALRLALGLAPWWRLRGRSVAGYALLRAPPDTPSRAMMCGPPHSSGWAHLAHGTADYDTALGHFTAVRDALAARGPSPELADGLAARSVALLNLDRVAEAGEDARVALALARGTGPPCGRGHGLAGSLLDLYVRRRC